MIWLRRLFRLLSEPGRALALLRGRWYRFYYPLRGVRLRVGSRFHAYGRLRIRGGAEVVIGNHVSLEGELLIEGSGTVILGNQIYITETLRILGPGKVVLGDGVCAGETTVLQTQHRVARIVIGDRTNLRGPYFNCVREIVVGEDCMIAPAMILDTDFHSTRADRRSPDSRVRVAPVHLSDNVWVGEWAGILPGTRIGKNSVVGFGAVCMREYPENVIILGNPARVTAPIPAGAEDELLEQKSAVLGSLYIPLRELRSGGQP